MEKYEDKSIGTIFAVCPGCHHTEMILMSEDGKGHEEWHCDRCWYAFNEKGQKLNKVYFGNPQTKCPECGDHRIARDNTGSYYCKGCKTAFPKAMIEPVRDQDGKIRGCRLTDFGDPKYPKPCPNCAEPLRCQVIEGLHGDYEAFVCGTCDLAYLKDEKSGAPRPYPECPKCGSYSLIQAGNVRECHFCGTRFDLDGEYLNPADKPQEGQHQSGQYAIGTVGTTPKIGG